jgi:DNA repair exonuclease SbcCD nuclease subunit
MKLLFMTDLHLRSKSDRPKWRVDDHYATQFAELAEIRDIAAANNIDLMVSIGDFFDNVRVSHQLVTDVLKWTQTLPCALYSVVGNHDVNAYVTTDRNNGLGVLFESGAVGQLNHDLVWEDKKVVLRGIDVFLDPKQGNYMFDEKYKSFCTIIASHNFIIPHVVPFDAVLPSQVTTNANIIALGHYHQSFNVYEKSTAFINPGSISRWAVNEQHQPQVFIVDTVTGVISAIQLKCSLLPTEIFDLAGAAEMKSTEMNLQTFVDSLNNTSFENMDVENVVLTEATKQGIVKEIVDLALAKVQAAKVELK